MSAVIARARSFVSSLRVTVAGVLLIALAFAASLAALLGPHRAQGAAFAVAALTLLVIVIGAVPGGLRGRGLSPALFARRDGRGEQASEVLDEVIDERPRGRGSANGVRASDADAAAGV